MFYKNGQMKEKTFEIKNKLTTFKLKIAFDFKL